MAASTFQKKIYAFFCVTIGLGAIFGFLSYAKFPAYERLEWATWDMRVKLTADPVAVDHDIRIIDIDQYSLTELAKDKFVWPWPRSLYVPILEFLKQGGAKGLAFDVLFTESDQSWVADEEAFGQALGSTVPSFLAMQAEMPLHLGPCPSSQPNQASLNKKVPVALPHILEKLRKQAEITQFENTFLNYDCVREYRSATTPIASLFDNATGYGIVNPMPDRDGTFRHYVPGVHIGGAASPALAFAFFAHLFPGKSVDLSSSLDYEGRLAMKFHGSKRTFKTYSFASIFYSYAGMLEGKTPQVQPSEFKDALVILGMSAPGLLDLRISPIDPEFPGVEVNATALDNLLHDRFIRKSGRLLDVLFTVLLIALSSASVLLFFRGRVLYLSLLLIIVGIFGGSYLAALVGWWIPAFNPLVATIASTMASLAIQYQFEGRQHKFIKDAFKYYVSPSVIDKIIEDPAKLSLGGERRELTIYFSDIAGFTTLSESMDPTKLVVLLNTYLSAMTDIIMASGGTVDKYEGDAIIAFWNAPLPIVDHAFLGVRAALECQSKLREMQGHFQSEFGVQLKTRIGLNSGVVSVGNFGSSERFNYTMIGDAANLASRLEGVNKVFGTLVIISDHTRDQFGDRLFCREIGGIRVVGKSSVVKIYEPIAEHPTSAMRELVEVFDSGRIAFEEARFEDAKRIFEEIAEDPVARVYLGRLKELGTVELENWSPVWNMSEK